jgi:hypothetical protein
LRRKILSVLLAGAVLVGGAAVAVAISGPDHRLTDRQASMLYLDARYALARKIDATLSAMVHAASEASQNLSQLCKGAMSGAPRTSAFGVLNAEILWAPRIAMWHSRADLVGDFLKATSHISWHNATWASLARAVSREERDRLRLAARNACSDVKMWTASGYKVLPRGVRGYLERIGKIMVVGDQALSELHQSTRRLEHCAKTKRGIMICTSKTENESAGGQTAESEFGNAPSTVLRLLARSDGARSEVLASHIAELEHEITHRETTAAARAGAQMTTAIGLDPAVLHLMP